ncbi:MAG: ABC transporter permease [Lentisphaeria bacterium]|nr:ABC transporter permease [Lentisphaeria bacterium]
MTGTLTICLRDLFRNRRRTLLVVGAVALGQAAVVFVNGMMAGFFRDIQRLITGPLVGHVQVHQPEWRTERAVDLAMDDMTARLRQVQGVPGVLQVSRRLYAAALAASSGVPGEAAVAEPAIVMGVDADSERVPGGLLEGLPRDECPEGARVLVGRVLATRLDLRPGDELALIGQDADGFPAADLFTVTGRLATNVDMINRMGVVMDVQRAGSFLALPDHAHEVVLWTDSPHRAGELARALRRLPALHGLEVLSWREAVPELVRLLDMKGLFDLIFVCVVLLAAAAGIANTAMMSTFERRREFGALLAIGARPLRIVLMVILEAVFLGLAGVVLGSTVGAGLVLITGRTGINYAALAGSEAIETSFRGLSFSSVTHPVFEWRQVAYGFGVILATSVLASLWPAVFAARLEPTEVLRR